MSSTPTYEVTLSAERRNATGSRASRRLRREDKIPAVLYGSTREPSNIMVQRADLRRALTTDAGLNALILLKVEGEDIVTMARELQHHPVRREVTHVDFLVVDSDALIEVEVPLVLVGEAKQVSLGGGMTEQQLHTLAVRVRPDAIPDEIEVDISEMEVDDVINVSDLSIPEGVEVVTPDVEPVVTADLARATMAEEDAEEEAAADEAAPADEAAAEE